MKNKNVLIGKIIKNIILVFVLFYLLFRITGIAKITIIPFIICGVSVVGKDICILLNKDQYGNVFSKIFIASFLTFWFGVLIFGSYLWIKEKRYFSLLFTIPFWMAGIYIVRKYLIK